MEVAFESLHLIPEILNRLKGIEKRLESSYGKRWLSVDEASKYLSYSKDRIYKIKTDELIEGKHYFKKGKLLFDKYALDEWVIGGHKNEQILVKKTVDDLLKSIINKYEKWFESKVISVSCGNFFNYFTIAKRNKIFRWHQ